MCTCVYGCTYVNVTMCVCINVTVLQLSDYVYECNNVYNDDVYHLFFTIMILMFVSQCSV